MLSNAGLTKEFWAESVDKACYLVNGRPSLAINLKTSEEMWSGSPAMYDNLKIFGCHVYAHVNEGKLEARAKKYNFLDILKM